MTTTKNIRMYKTAKIINKNWTPQRILWLERWIPYLKFEPKWLRVFLVVSLLHRSVHLLFPVILELTSFGCSPFVEMLTLRCSPCEKMHHCPLWWRSLCCVLRTWTWISVRVYRVPMMGYCDRHHAWYSRRPAWVASWMTYFWSALSFVLLLLLPIDLWDWVSSPTV